MVDVLTKEQAPSVILVPVWTPNITHAASSFLQRFLLISEQGLNEVFSHTYLELESDTPTPSLCVILSGRIL